MGLLDVLTGRMPLFKPGRNVLRDIEQEFSELLNPNPSDKNFHSIPRPSFQYDNLTPTGQTGNNDSGIRELRVTTSILTDGVNQVLILKNSATAQDVQEISVQPNADCHLQIFEAQNGTPITAVRFVPANGLWSVPGKVCYSSLFIFCAEGGVALSCEVRTLPIP